MTKPLSLRSGSRSLPARVRHNVTIPETGTRVRRAVIRSGDRTFRDSAGKCPRLLRAAERNASRGSSRQITLGQDSLDGGSPTAPDEFQDLAAQCIVSCIELADHRKVIVQLHTREARACAVPFA